MYPRRSFYREKPPQITLIKITEVELVSLQWGISVFIKISGVTFEDICDILSSHGKPKDAVAVLGGPGGGESTQSREVLEYFADICDNHQPIWQVERAKEGDGAVLGRMLEENAPVTAKLALEYCTTSQSQITRNTTREILDLMVEMDRVTAKLALASCTSTLHLLAKDLEGLPRPSGRDELVSLAFYVL
ncbi:hypothetical protein CEK25_009205 [Fusarium fujikuroi]|nr:hypothetical protein CEK25_009205 [Fusarium fujikuroi]